MFRPKRWRKRGEWPESVVADGPLNEDEAELIFTEPTYDDLAGLFEELISTVPEYDDLADRFEELID